MERTICNQEVGGSIPLVSTKSYLIEIYDNQEIRLELPRWTERFIREGGIAWRTRSL
jgi:hypothetical protein